jgi:uncharacterized protein YehS (DUF1456 family)
MNNNDILIRLRYALDLKNIEMVEIFALGGVKTTKEEVLKLLTKEGEDQTCSNHLLEQFLNGFIIYKRGVQEPKPGQPANPPILITNDTQRNNVVLKKLKIALSLTSEEMLEILEEAGVFLSKGELSAVFRKEGHKNYVECGDRYVRKFLKGLTMKYRPDSTEQ